MVSFSMNTSRCYPRQCRVQTLEGKELSRNSRMNVRSTLVPHVNYALAIIVCSRPGRTSSRRQSSLDAICRGHSSFIWISSISPTETAEPCRTVSNIQSLLCARDLTLIKRPSSRITASGLSQTLATTFANAQVSVSNVDSTVMIHVWPFFSGWIERCNREAQTYEIYTPVDDLSRINLLVSGAVDTPEEFPSIFKSYNS